MVLKRFIPDQFFKFPDLFFEASQTFDVRVLTFVFVERLDGRAPPDAAPNDFAGQNSGLRTDHRARFDGRVIAETDLPEGAFSILPCRRGFAARRDDLTPRCRPLLLRRHA